MGALFHFHLMALPYTLLLLWDRPREGKEQVQDSLVLVDTSL
jgi:hypothetical protein